MTGETETVALWQRLIERKHQPLTIFNWDYTDVPEKSRGKAPSEKNWQKTRGMPRYRPYASNTGVLCGPIHGVDSDVDDPEIAAEIRAKIESLFGRTVVRVRANSPRCLLVYRSEHTDACKRVIRLSVGKIEILGCGQQFVGYGRHPSGAEYQWEESALDEVRLDELPVITEKQIDALAAWAESRWPVVEKAKPNGHGGKGGHDFRNSCLREDVEAALKQLPCDYERETWVKLSRAYRAGGGSYEVFLAWSRTHPSYKSDDYLKQQWDSFKHSHSVTVRTLFAEVFKRFPKWRKPSERDANYTDPAEDDDWEGEPGDESPESPFTEPPLPLFPKPEEAAPYPVAALGALRDPVEAIAAAAGVSPTLAAQSVLAVACLAAMPLVDIKLPSGHVRPLSLYLVTIAKSGERKTASDERALIGIELRKEELKRERAPKERSFAAKLAAYNAQYQIIRTNRKITYEQREKLLEPLGPAPKLPPRPIFTSQDATVEGLLKLWDEIQPNHGLFSSEGGTFVKGIALSDDYKMRTATVLSTLWDNGTYTKLRAGDGVGETEGKRLALHVMIQPTLVGSLLGDSELRGQGFLSRFLLAWPPSKIGKRPFQLPDDVTEARIQAFGRKIQALLRRVVTTGDNKLEPRTLAIELESKAFPIWRDYHDEVDPQLQEGARFEEMTAVGSKSAEMAGRIAGVLTIIGNPKALAVTAEAMAGGVALARWYLEETRRLQESSVLDPALGHAVRVLKWLQAHPEQRTTRHVMKDGPRPREKTDADRALGILEQHGWIAWVSKRKTRFVVREEPYDDD